MLCSRIGGQKESGGLLQPDTEGGEESDFSSFVGELFAPLRSRDVGASTE